MPDDVVKPIGDIMAQLPVAGLLLIVVMAFCYLLWKLAAKIGAAMSLQATNHREHLTAVTTKFDKTVTEEGKQNRETIAKNNDVIERNTAGAAELKAWFESTQRGRTG